METDTDVRVDLLLGIFCLQSLFLEKLEYWHILAQTKSKMWLLNLMHSVLLVRLGFLQRAHGS